MLAVHALRTSGRDANQSNSSVDVMHSKQPSAWDRMYTLSCSTNPAHRGGGGGGGAGAGRDGLVVGVVGVPQTVQEKEM
eukprot:COSAG04_NODE_222_length_19676_cov_26.070991_17_plen_78_part_01